MKKRILVLCFCEMLHVSLWAFGPPNTSPFIRIDQFGYRPNAAKVAVIISPQTGFDAPSGFNPSTGTNQYQLRKWDNNEVVFTGSLQAWSNGAIDANSGDKGWWFDFSSVTAPGSYYVFDVGNNAGSYRFDIAENIYNNVLKAAVRMFYYNRCGFEKKAEHAGANWADGASFNGPGQDKNCRSVLDRNNAATEKDLSGGWWDAGDYNKYVTFATQPVHQLLDAYEQNPSIWGDDYNIPESGNSFPDLLDELKWELEWLKKMQQSDGAVLVKMGTLKNTDNEGTLPPSTDPRKRYYYPGGCSAAAIATAGMFAHAAKVYRSFPSQAAFSEELEQRAIAAFNWYVNNPKSITCDDGTIQAGDADWSLEEQEKHMVAAAVYLYALTNDAIYRFIVDNHYNKLTAIKDNWWGPYEKEADALLYYTTLPGASANVKNNILQKKLETAGYADFYNWRNSEKDPYRAFISTSMFHWGSLSIRANVASINYDMIVYNLDATNHNNYKKRAEEMLHYYHGVNPLNTVYLTNMSSYGAEKSIAEVYHSWFKDGSAWDNPSSSKGGPAPGYVPGGPNKTYKDGNGKCLFSPPCNQPPAKSYKDWNTVWPDASWEVTEPAIYYQSAYIKMLSHFATNGPGIVTGVENIARNNFFEAELFPNPNNGTVQLKYRSKTTKPFDIKIFDNTGKLIRKTIEKTGSYTGNFSLQLPATAGIYLVQLTQDKQPLVLKTIVASRF